jgi:hypothetical protein
VTRKRWVLGVCLGVFVLQFIRPAQPGQQLEGDGPIDVHIEIPPQIQALLKAACYDCHSAETRWPVYSQISPVSWLLARHVRHGRSDLDFSHWSIDPVREPTPTQRLRGICNDVREQIMPPRSYALMHPRARLSEQDREAICRWTLTAASSGPGDE